MAKKTVYTSKLLRESHRAGFQEGRKQGLVRAALELARAKLPGLAANDEQRIQAVHDDRALTELVLALGQAVAPSDARAALDALPVPPAPAS